MRARKGTSAKKKSQRKRHREPQSVPFMSEVELARLGGGEVAYLKTMTSDEALKMFPAIEDVPPGINLFALHAADGTPIALTDTRQAAISHAMEGELQIASVH